MAGSGVGQSRNFFGVYFHRGTPLCLGNINVQKQAVAGPMKETDSITDPIRARRSINHLLPVATMARKSRLLEL